MELWTIKGVPIETRKRVIAAALQEGLTVGRWLERRANEWQDHQELRELVQMASDLSPKDGSLLRLGTRHGAGPAEGTQSGRVKCRTAGWPPSCRGRDGRNATPQAGNPPDHHAVRSKGAVWNMHAIDTDYAQR
jgi:hypothetical protein